MNFEKIFKLINKDIINFQIELERSLYSNVDLIKKCNKYILNNNGKFIRPIAIILAAKSLFYNKKKHIILASLIELIHMSTLLHDDIIDDAKKRRGNASVNVVFGNIPTILIGDFIYTRAFQMISKLRSFKIFKIISNAVNMIVEGEILQLTYCNSVDITIKNYMQIIYKKTAKLFEVSLQSAAILSKSSYKEEQAFKNYGRYLGISFQIIDDFLDYKSDFKKFGKILGNDLKEGKVTLPLIHAMKNSNNSQFLLIKEAIQKGNHSHLLNDILKIMEEHRSLEYTREYAKKKIEKAISFLNELKYSIYIEALENLAKFYLNCIK
ncbi:ispB [Wigglesworthia glossinidia endosymbiont of Glossina brevipalpis]|uniref:IspB protein n=1 Tax=Wigglesworthia glossinidia brevipalpis TaxID=36870 RepID=Q8D276_WIGBR|nr:ispB [Wigglesworthia glossinidia endosymbiont of Glossina brevipalpis]